MTLDKFFDDLNEADLQQLLGKKVSGCKTVEYKECLPGDTIESQKEFLAEVTSFANTAGGCLIYGIKEENGTLVALPGLPGKDPDCEILRLEKLLRDHIQPRCQGITIRTIEMTSAAPVLLLHIPESWSKPHVVNFQGHWRFYARNSIGKYSLSITELKSAFLTTAGLGERIRSFHCGRLSKLACGDAPVPLAAKPKTAFHLIPYSAFESGSLLSFSSIEDIWSIPLMHASTSSYRYNLDGLVVYNEKGLDGCSEGYTQVFRKGIIESVNVNLFGSSSEGPYLPNVKFEMDITSFLNACLAFYKRSSVQMPAALFVSLVGVQDCKLATHQQPDPWHDYAHRIDRDSLLLPEVIIENLAVNSAAVLKPIFNAAWNSLGWERLYECDEAREKDLLFPREKLVKKQVDISQVAKMKGR